jgi:hypothetical protein
MAWMVHRHKYFIDSWMVMPRAWDRLERSIRWGYKKKYGRMPSKGELKRVKSELYSSEIIRRNMERAGGHDSRNRERGGGESR